MTLNRPFAANIDKQFDQYCKRKKYKFSRPQLRSPWLLNVSRHTDGPSPCNPAEILGHVGLDRHAKVISPWAL